VPFFNRQAIKSGTPQKRIETAGSGLLFSARLDFFRLLLTTKAEESDANVVTRRQFVWKTANVFLPF
jgi:hypothetical protein